MKRLTILTILVVSLVSTAVEAKTRTYAGGFIRVTTHRRSYRPHSNYSYGRYGYPSYGSYGYNRYGHRNTGGIKYSDAKKGLKIQSDFFTTLITGGKQVNDVITISKKAREAPKLTAQEKKQAEVERLKLELEIVRLKAELEKAKAELEKNKP